MKRHETFSYPLRMDVKSEGLAKSSIIEKHLVAVSLW